MARTVKIDEIGRLIDEKPYNIPWFSFDLGGGWGSRLTKYNKKGAARGIITPGIGNEVSIIQVHKKLKNNDFTDIAGFYVAILCFFGEKIYEKLDFVEKIPKNSINKVVSAQKCPEHLKSEIYDICHGDYDFLDFISAASRLERTNFDEKSAISTYKLQGDAAIYPLLCQMFYVNKGVEQLSPCLIPQLPIQLTVQVSNYVSGCNFPVVVSPAVDNFEWQENQNGWFLYADYKGEKRVLDVAGVGSVNLSNYALTNRLNYLGGGGKAIPYLICWNWGDIIEAYHYFDSDLLIRDLKNDLFTNYWFVFGLDSLLSVRFRGGFINFDKNYLVEPNFNSSFISVDKHANAYLITDLAGNFVDYCDKKDVFYSDSEVFDWFELGKMLK